ncbi:hypothetical protein ABW19_dt0200948 [Dactylella cylindrospora]|nr:hypothetical protein ABW19_dt0200948 [Dactylella cylindrospora]
MEDAGASSLKPYLAIHSLLPQHYTSTEWSSQGLSRTLSSIIDTATITSHSVLLSVSSASTIFGIDSDLPLVNSRMMKNNTKKKGFYGGEGFENEEDGERDLRFVGKVRDVVERWFRVVRIEKLVEEDVGMKGVEEEDRSSQIMLV